MRKISIVLPLYNEEAIIADTYQALASVIDSVPDYDFRIIFSVDGATDNSLNILTDISKKDPRITILVLSRRFGHQVALLAGIDQGDIDSHALIMMDSDLQHPPSLIPKLLEKFEEGYDIVQAERTNTQGAGLLKNLTSSFFYWVINRIGNTKISPGAADFRLISNKVLRAFRRQIRERNQFLRGLFYWMGYNHCTVKYIAPQRPAGESKYSILRMISFASDGITSFSKAPLRFAIYIGLFVSFLAFIHTVMVIYWYFSSSAIPTGWSTLAVISGFLGGMQLVFLGIIGEYIGKIFDEVKARPHYLVGTIVKNGEEQRLEA